MSRAAGNRGANKAQQRGSARPTLPLCTSNRNGRAKTSYRSRAAAMKRARASTANFFPYQCRACSLWHLTSNKPEVRP